MNYNIKSHIRLGPAYELTTKVFMPPKNTDRLNSSYPYTMKKVLNIILKALLTLILLMPILGATGVFPAPTPDMYNTKEAYDFIAIIMAGKYIPILNALVFGLSIVALWTNRVALAAALMFPVTLNIVCFHLFLDGGLFTSGAIAGNVLLLLNLYFLWDERKEYCYLMKPSKG
jgi:hypothetical protein